MCQAAMMLGDTGAAILIIPGTEGKYTVDPHFRPEYRDNWGLN